MKKYWLIFLVLISSCKKEISIKLPDLEIKPVINCLFTEGEPFRVHIGLPNIANNPHFQIIENATVSISDSNDTYMLDYEGEGYYSTPNVIAKTGVLYSLKVQTPDFEAVFAKDSIPRIHPKLISYTTRSKVGINSEDGAAYSSLMIWIKDHAAKNYYGIDCIYPKKKSAAIANHASASVEGFFSHDPSVKNEGLEMYSSPLLLFRDELFNGKEYSFELFYYSSPKNCYLFNFSPNMFQYLKTWIIHDYTKDYDFWEAYEPITMYSNIENGYGIFAGYSKQSFEIKPDFSLTF